jgi:hypothetical protein
MYKAHLNSLKHAPIVYNTGIPVTTLCVHYTAVLRTSIICSFIRLPAFLELAFQYISL